MSATIRSVSGRIYFCLDRSGSMLGSRMANQIAATVGVLEELRDNSVGFVAIKIVGFSEVSNTIEIERSPLDAAAYADLIAFVQGLTAINNSGTNYEIATAGVPAFFASAGVDDSKFVLFLTDGEATEGSQANNLAALASVPNLNVAGFIINSGEIAVVAEMDNTPDDGVPIVGGGSSEEIEDALRSILASGAFPAQTMPYHQYALEIALDPLAPTTFERVCGFMNFRYVRTANIEQTMTPDCADETLPHNVAKGVSSLEFSVEIEAVWAQATHDKLMRWFYGGQSRPIRVIANEADIGQIEYEEADAMVETWGNVRAKGARVAGDITLAISGRPTRVLKS